MKFKSVITWSLSLGILIFVFMSLYPSFADDADLLNDVMSNMPKEFLEAFGMAGIDMSSVLGFFGMILLFIQICIAIQAANYGFGLVSVEETDLTADFLLAKPVGRIKIITSKLLAALSSLAITNLAIWIATYGFVNAYSSGRPYDADTLILLLFTVTFLQLFFLTVGMVISLLMKKVRSVTPLSMGLAFGMYMLAAFEGMLGEDKLSYITPFKHFEANQIIKSGSYDTPLVMISVTVIIISVVASYVLYSKRDIHSV